MSFSFETNNREVVDLGELSTYSIVADTPGAIRISPGATFEVNVPANLATEMKQTIIVITPNLACELKFTFDGQEVRWCDYQIRQIQRGMMCAFRIVQLQGHVFIHTLFEGQNHEWVSPPISDDLVVYFGDGGAVGWCEDVTNSFNCMNYQYYGTVNIRKAVYRNADKTMVAVGSHGGVLSGQDPSNLHVSVRHPEDPNAILESVICRQSDGMFMSVGAQEIIYGTDPQHFLEAENNGAKWIEAHCRSVDGLFIVLGENGQFGYAMNPASMNFVTYGSQNLEGFDSRPDGLMVVGGLGQLLYGYDPENLSSMPLDDSTVSFYYVTWSEVFQKFFVMGQKPNGSHTYWYGDHPESLIQGAGWYSGAKVKIAPLIWDDKINVFCGYSVFYGTDLDNLTRKSSTQRTLQLRASDNSLFGTTVSSWKWPRYRSGTYTSPYPCETNDSLGPVCSENIYETLTFPSK